MFAFSPFHSSPLKFAQENPGVSMKIVEKVGKVVKLPTTPTASRRNAAVITDK